jgi:hypothetical protein
LHLIIYKWPDQPWQKYMPICSRSSLPDAN